MITNLWRNPPAQQRVGDRFLEILLKEGIISAEVISNLNPQIHLAQAEKQRAKAAIAGTHRPLIFLIPDAGMPIKRWPAENFIALGKALHQQFNASILVATGADAALSTHIADEIGGTAKIWPRGDLRELAAVLSQADLVVGADTGPVRMAAACDVPTLTLFGPSWHGRYGQAEPHINLQGYPDCPERNIGNFTHQRCWYSGVCPFGWQTCTEAISPQEVMAHVTRMMPTTPVETLHATSLLVMRLDNIGDAIMTTPALRAIKENLPQAKITLMASPGGALAAPLLPWVDEVMPWRVLWQDLGKLAFDPAREWELIATLRQRQFDAAIIFTSFSQSPHPAGLICSLAGIPFRVGESKEWEPGTLTHAIPPAPDELHQVERNLRLIESLGFKVRDRRLCLTIPLLEFPAVPYILLNPWTSCQSRNYDPHRFAIAARWLAELTGWPVVVTGMPKDRDRASSILAPLGESAIDLVGKTDLPQFAALIANARLVLTNNTSAMHIADATNTPCVVLFAGTELECQWQPRFTPVKLLRRPTVCSPCYTFTCPYDLECLDIPPQAVVDAGLELLEEAGRVGDRIG